MEQSVPISVDDLYIDWQIINETKDKTTVFLAAAPKSIVNSYMQLFTLLNLDPIALEMSLGAIARSMVSNKQKIEPVIIFDIGDQSSNIAVFDSNLQVTGSHPIGGGTIRQLLENTLKISDKESYLLTRGGIKGKTKEADIIRAEVDKLILEIKKIDQYYKEKTNYDKPLSVLICGGLGFMPGLPEYLKEHGYESRVGNPWVNISIYPIKPVPKEEVPGYATAIGLSLRGLEND